MREKYPHDGGWHKLKGNINTNSHGRNKQNLIEIKLEGLASDFWRLAPWTKAVRELRMMSTHEKIMAKSEKIEVDQNKSPFK